LILAIRARADLGNDQVDGRASESDVLANKREGEKLRQSPEKPSGGKYR